MAMQDNQHISAHHTALLQLDNNSGYSTASNLLFLYVQLTIMDHFICLLHCDNSWKYFPFTFFKLNVKSVCT